MKKTLIICSLFYITFSCNSLKDETYQVLNRYLENRYTYNFASKKVDFDLSLFDTIYILKNPVLSRNFSLKLETFNEPLSINPFYKNVYWNNPEEIIFIDDDDFLFIKRQINNTDIFFSFEDEKFSLKNVVIISQEDLFKKKINPKSIVFDLSKPIFNKDRSIAIINLIAKSMNNKILTASKIVMYKKDNNWHYIANILERPSPKEINCY
jgi:hypothetical protein